MPLRSQVSFSVQLGLMLESGVPILRALQVLERSQEPGLAPAANKLADSINQGHLLSTAMARLPESFSAMFVRLIHSGEASGRITEVLRGLARELERTQRQLERTRQALAYPAAVFGVSGLMVAFMVYYMLPQFLTMFQGFGQPLPPPTRLLMALVFNPQVRILVPVVFLVLPGLVYHQRNRPDVAHLLQQLRYGLPLLGPIQQQMAMSRLCGNLAMMGTQGVVLLDAIRLLQGTTGFHLLDVALREVAAEVKTGATLGQALKTQSIFPGLVVHACVAGEETSDVFEALRHCSRLLEEQAEGRLDSLLSLLEPLIMGVMGLIVAFIVLATFLPIYQLASANL